MTFPIPATDGLHGLRPFLAAGVLDLHPGLAIRLLDVPGRDRQEGDEAAALRGNGANGSGF